MVTNTFSIFHKCFKKIFFLPIVKTYNCLPRGVYLILNNPPFLSTPSGIRLLKTLLGKWSPAFPLFPTMFLNPTVKTNAVVLAISTKSSASGFNLDKVKILLLDKG